MYLRTTVVISLYSISCLISIRENICFLVNDQRDAQILFYVFISNYNSLHVSSKSCSSSGETNCINTASGNSHSMLVAEMCAGWKKTDRSTFKLSVWCGAEGCLYGLQAIALQPANRKHNPQIHTIPTTWKPNHQTPEAAATCIILSSSWWWA